MFLSVTHFAKKMTLQLAKRKYTSTILKNLKTCESEKNRMLSSFYNFHSYFHENSDNLNQHYIF